MSERMIDMRKALLMALVVSALLTMTATALASDVKPLGSSRVLFSDVKPL